MTAATAAQAASRAGARKRDAVAQLTEKLGRATSAVVTDYRGISVKELESLRSSLREAGIDYIVVKNTLARRAAEAAGAAGFSQALVGPVGLALGYGEISAPARVLNQYFQQTKKLPMMAGFVEGQVLGAVEIKQIAELPTRDVLLAQLAGTLQSPLNQFAGTLDSVLSTFAAALDARRSQLEAA